MELKKETSEPKGLGIKTFEIKRLFNKFDVKLPLDQNVNIFIGENGLGKTTILNCFYYTLQCDFMRLSNIKFKEIVFTFTDDEKLCLSYEKIYNYASKHKNAYTLKNRYDYDSPFFLDMKRREWRSKTQNDEIMDFIIKEKINNEILHFPTYRRIEEDSTKLGIRNWSRKYMYGFRDYDSEDERIKFGMKDVKYNISRLLEEIKSRSIDSFRKMTGSLIEQYLNDSVGDKLVNSSEINITKLDIALARIGNEIERDTKKKIKKLVEEKKIYNNEHLLNLIKNLIDSYEEQKKYDEKIKDFVKVCNGYLRGKQYFYDESTVRLAIVSDDGEEINMKDLSSGEKQIVSTFSKLYIEDTKDCIVIFDEPELSLSISWQEKFLPDIMNSGKCKFMLVATHSPFIFSNEFNSMVKYMGEYIGE